MESGRNTKRHLITIRPRKPHATVPTVHMLNDRFEGKEFKKQINNKLTIPEESFTRVRVCARSVKGAEKFIKPTGKVNLYTKRGPILGKPYALSSRILTVGWDDVQDNVLNYCLPIVPSLSSTLSMMNIYEPLFISPSLSLARSLSLPISLLILIFVQPLKNFLYKISGRFHEF